MNVVAAKKGPPANPQQHVDIAYKSRIARRRHKEHARKEAEANVPPTPSFAIVRTQLHKSHQHFMAIHFQGTLVPGRWKRVVEINYDKCDACEAESLKPCRYLQGWITYEVPEFVHYSRTAKGYNE